MEARHGAVSHGWVEPAVAAAADRTA
jgi:hypothetical protein